MRDGICMTLWKRLAASMMRSLPEVGELVMGSARIGCTWTGQGTPALKTTPPAEQELEQQWAHPPSLLIRDLGNAWM